MSLKVYIKRGNTNYKEKKLIKAIQESIGEKMASNPDFKFEPARNFEDLKKLHDQYVAEPVNYEEVKETFDGNNNKPKSDEKMSEEIEDIEEIEEIKETSTSSSSDRDYVDPFNRDNPIVRDYVMEGKDYADDKAKEIDENQTFDEPTSEKEAFELPTDDESDESDDKKAEKQKSESSEKKEKPKSDEPLNPAFNTMDTKKKKRSTKRFAKYIVSTVCMLAEKGFVWFANKDINDAKLAEYEMSGEIDLSLIVTLEGGQEATVKEFFQQQSRQAEELAKISDDDKEELTAALTEVLLEKGVAPTPTQELIMVSLSVLGGQVVILMGLKQQTNSLLNQLRAMNEGHVVEENYEQAAYEHQAAAEEHEKAAQDFEKAAEVHEETELSSTVEEVVDESQLLISDQAVETKE